MNPPIPDLSKARVLLTNDDGIGATGLAVLEKIVSELCEDVWVVAPEVEQSGAGHSLTLRRPLRLRRLGDRRFAVDGTPTDSVLMAVGHVLKEHKPDLVISGVNRGGNLGEDMTYSGTVSAAMEGTLLGVPSIALSLVTSPGNKAHWDTVERHAPDVIRRLAAAGWRQGVLINVNFPEVPPEEVTGVELVGLGHRKIGDHLEERFDPRGVAYYWIGPLRQEEPHRRDTDLGAVLEGAIAVTPVHLDLTDKPSLKALAGAFE
jgi:5'-nucleotidase